MEAVEGFINSGAEPAEKMIRDMVECELAFINTDHPAFLGGNRAIGMVMEVNFCGVMQSTGAKVQHSILSFGISRHPASGNVASRACDEALVLLACVHFHSQNLQEC